MKKLLLVGIAAFAFAAPASASSNVQITIRHQVQHCHAWAIGSGAYKASQSITVARGATISFTNNDVMSHKLVQLSGPHVQFLNVRSSTTMAMGGHWPFAAGLMGNMGAGTKATFTKAGTYTFKTIAGEDYMKGMKTTGEDNVLRLTVTVK